MFGFPKNSLPLRAAFTAVFVLFLAFSANISSARAVLPDLQDAVIRIQDCDNQACLYIPSAQAAGGSGKGGEIPGRSEAVGLYREMYLPSSTSQTGWNGDYNPCQPGATAQTFRSAVLMRVNYFRRMAGVPVLEGLRVDMNAQEQEAALMMSRNKALSHAPDSSWACFTTAGQEAAGKSNLALGANGPVAIDMYMSDYGQPALGHRRWLLYPQTRWAATGDIPAGEGYPAANAFRVFDENMWGARPPTRDGFVAWPPPGYVPYQVVYPYWSFAYPSADFSRASVQVTSGGKTLGLTRYAQQDGYGENALVWSMDGFGSAWPKPAADTAYQVQIRGVVIQGKAQDFSYTVTVIDP